MTPPPALIELWDEHMLAGSHMGIAFRGSDRKVWSSSPSDAFASAHGVPEDAGLGGGIIVERLDEGLWRNGGWSLRGGRLSWVADGDRAIQLYGRAVIRQPSYVPFPFHVHIPPARKAYDFFLLQRRPIGDRGVIRHWVFGPDDAATTRNKSGYVFHEEVSGALQYDRTLHTASVTVTGLKYRFQENVLVPR